ncbi:unnamed protein product [Trichogramma brassicae]|uniref:Uncharacterized protein n=1 Tax=Trichogramma brassicae TaxID=86971 RepID=A0A6H5I8F3_9HYME|nr:unnamed protein product [Trichogramma brassicae]
MTFAPQPVSLVSLVMQILGTSINKRFSRTQHPRGENRATVYNLQIRLAISATRRTNDLLAWGMRVRELITDIPTGNSLTGDGGPARAYTKQGCRCPLLSGIFFWRPGRKDEHTRQPRPRTCRVHQGREETCNSTAEILYGPSQHLKRPWGARKCSPRRRPLWLPPYRLRGDTSDLQRRRRGSQRWRSVLPDFTSANRSSTPTTPPHRIQRGDLHGHERSARPPHSGRNRLKNDRVGRPSLSYTNSSEETRRKKRGAIVSEIHTNTDLFNRLLMSSDPLVSMCRNMKERKKHDYTQEMRNLILETDGTETFEYESENDVDEACDVAMSRGGGCHRREPVLWWTNEIADLRRACLRARRLAQISRGRPNEETHRVEFAATRRLLRAVIKNSKLLGPPMRGSKQQHMKQAVRDCDLASEGLEGKII